MNAPFKPGIGPRIMSGHSLPRAERFGMYAHEVTRTEAKKASDALLTAIFKMCARFEWIHRLPPGAGLNLQLKGYRLP